MAIAPMDTRIASTSAKYLTTPEQARRGRFDRVEAETNK
jgi:hypothetical protein